MLIEDGSYPTGNPIIRGRQVQLDPRSCEGVYSDSSPFLTYFYTVSLQLGGAQVILVMHNAQ